MDLVMSLSRSGRGHGLRPVPRRGRARGRPDRPCGAGSLSRRSVPSRGSAMALLEVEDVVAGYGAGPDILNGAVAPVRAGPAAMHHRPERRRQIDAAASAICGPAAGARAASHASRASARRAAHRPDPAPRHLLRAAGRSLFPDMTVQREPPDGRLHAARPPRGRARIETVFEMFPILRERARAAGQGRSPAASSRCCCLARALVLQPRAHHAGRALARPGAARSRAQIFDIMDRLRRAGMTIILVEQNASGPRVRRLGLRARPGPGGVRGRRRRRSSRIRASRSCTSGGAAPSGRKLAG